MASVDPVVPERNSGGRAVAVVVEDLNDAQREIFDALYHDRKGFVVGYAGTGKTIIATLLADKLHGAAVLCAPTHKACQVLRQKGAEAATWHSTFYRPHVTEIPVKGGRPRRSFEWILREDIWADRHKPPCIILDEVSMLPQAFLDDIESLGVPVVMFGDSMQLPPVNERGILEREPDFLLTEVVRQQEGSDVLAAATAVRKGERVSIPVIKFNHTPSAILEFDQIICYKHTTRKMLNQAMRRHLEFTDPLPMVGDRLVTTENSVFWKKYDSLTVVGDSRYDPIMQQYVVDVQFAGMTHKDIPFDIPTLVEGMFKFEPKKIDKEMKGVSHFRYGYAITCHSAQGSEWDRVLIARDYDWLRTAADREDMTAEDYWKRWRYTALTRARDEVALLDLETY